MTKGISKKRITNVVAMLSFIAVTVAMLLTPILAVKANNRDNGLAKSQDTVIYNGDFNEDGVIDEADVNEILTTCLLIILGKNVECNSAFDLNGDGMLNISDIILMLRAFRNIDNSTEEPIVTTASTTSTTTTTTSTTTTSTTTTSTTTTTTTTTSTTTTSTTTSTTTTSTTTTSTTTSTTTTTTTSTTTTTMTTTSTTPYTETRLWRERYVGDGSWNLRENASLSSNIIGKLYTGSEYDILSYEGGDSWYKVNFNGVNGYIMKTDLTLFEVVPGTTTVSTIQTERFLGEVWNIRKAPSLESEITGQLKESQLFGVVAYVSDSPENQWVAIVYGKGNHLGYILKNDFWDSEVIY